MEIQKYKRYYMYLNFDHVDELDPQFVDNIFVSNMEAMRDATSNQDTANKDPTNNVRVTKHKIEHGLNVNDEYVPDGIIGLIVCIEDDKYMELWLRLCDQDLVGFRLVRSDGSSLSKWIAFGNNYKFVSLNLAIECAGREEIIDCSSAGLIQLKNRCLKFYNLISQAIGTKGELESKHFELSDKISLARAYKTMCIGFDLIESNRLWPIYNHMRYYFQHGAKIDSGYLARNINDWGDFSTNYENLKHYGKLFGISNARYANLKVLVDVKLRVILANMVDRG